MQHPFINVVTTEDITILSPEKRKKQQKQDIVYVTSVLQLFCTLFALPIASIIMGIIHRDDYEECNKTFITFQRWLFVNGITMIPTVIHYHYVAFKFSQIAHFLDPSAKTCTSALKFIMLLFNLIWMIIGSNMFRNCEGKIYSKTMEIILWTIIPIGYIWLTIMIKLFSFVRFE